MNESELQIELDHRYMYILHRYVVQENFLNFAKSPVSKQEHNLSSGSGRSKRHGLEPTSPFALLLQQLVDYTELTRIDKYDL